MSDKSAIFLAREAGLDIHEVIIKIAADRAKTDETKKAWETVLGKLRSQGLYSIQGLILGLMGFLLTADAWSQYALYALYGKYKPLIIIQFLIRRPNQHDYKTVGYECYG